MPAFDALLLVSFGGPERTEDVIPFLENVLRGKNVPRERMLQVAEHYYHFGGKSPINDHNRALIQALEPVLPMPVYWGNRNWHPLLPDTLRAMHAAGIRRVAALMTSAFGSYSGCRQYRENVGAALAATGLEGELTIEKLPNFYYRPEFLEAMTDRVRQALAEAPGAREIAFTAHSIPVSMADACPYVGQLRQACGEVAQACGITEWSLVYQSRSGPPSQPWLEPDIGDHLNARYEAGVRDIVICPIGFLSDHMEVLYDLDTEARARCEELGMTMARAGTAGTHPKMIEMIVKLVAEGATTPILAHCEPGCCPAPMRPQAR